MKLLKEVHILVCRIHLDMFLEGDDFCCCCTSIHFVSTVSMVTIVCAILLQKKKKKFLTDSIRSKMCFQYLQFSTTKIIEMNFYGTVNHALHHYIFISPFVYELKLPKLFRIPNLIKTVKGHRFVINIFTFISVVDQTAISPFTSYYYYHSTALICIYLQQALLSNAHFCSSLIGISHFGVFTYVYLCHVIN